MARIVIAGAGPLVAVAKADLLGILGDLFGCVHLSMAAYQECMAKRCADSQAIQRAVEKSVLRVELPEPADLFQLPRSLGDGEK